MPLPGGWRLESTRARRRVRFSRAEQPGTLENPHAIKGRHLPMRPLRLWCATPRRTSRHQVFLLCRPDVPRGVRAVGPARHRGAPVRDMRRPCVMSQASNRSFARSARKGAITVLMYSSVRQARTASAVVDNIVRCGRSGSFGKWAHLPPPIEFLIFARRPGKQNRPALV